jgi:DNA invertase Pin-like site-specific DNA recombinase
MTARAREVWVSYLRVSTPEQAAKDLSFPAQREAVEEYAHRNGRGIAREYLESGCSGTDINRKAFRQMLEDVLKPGSDIGTSAAIPRLPATTCTIWSSTSRSTRIGLL